MQTRTLSNGLVIIAKEMRHAPVAAFSVWYRVGGRNEVPGITGISHWAEHMMFKGTARFGKGALDRLVTSRGGEWNGFTTEDFTAYYEVLPSEHLRVAVEIEADRMANCLFDPAEVESERTVIISEREGAENEPVFWLTEAVQAMSWTVHPYRQGVIGAKCDLQAITRDDLFAHYRAYYSPDNAVAVAAGDFSASELFDMVETNFGLIPTGPARSPLRSVEPPQEGPRRLTVNRPGPVPYLLTAHHVPGISHQDIPALLCLQAVLAGAQSPVGWLGRRMGKSSRLYRKLVRGGLAVRVEAAVELRTDPSAFHTLATACPGVEPVALEDAIAAELGGIASNGITPQELDTAKQQLRAQIAYSRAGVLGHATWLGLFAMVSDTRLSDTFGEAIAAVTSDDISRVAGTYLRPDNGTTGWFIPQGQSGGAHPAANQQCYKGLRRGGFGIRSAGAAQPHGLPGPSDIERRRLESGLVVLACRHPAVEHVELLLRLSSAGSALDTPEAAGLANFAARGTLHGTASRPFEVLNEQLDAMGASLAADCGPDAARWRGSCLTADLPVLAGLLGELLNGPAYTPEDVEHLRTELLTAIRERDQDTRDMAQRVVLETAYPQGHAYGMHPLGSLESLARVGQRELLDFHAAHYGPAHAVLALAGPLTPSEMIEQAAQALAGWRAAQAAPHADAGAAATTATAVTPVTALTASASPTGQGFAARHNVNLPGKTQSDVAMAIPALSRRDADFEPLAILNLILGRLGLGGRLGQRVREDLGLAYYCYSALAERTGTGPWILSAGVNPANVELAITTISEELQRIRREPVTQEELDTALGFARGSLFLDVENAAGLAQWLLRMETFSLGLDYLHRYPQRLAEVTPQALLQVAERYLDPARMALAVAGPQEMSLVGTGHDRS